MSKKLFSVAVVVALALAGVFFGYGFVGKYLVKPGTRTVIEESGRKPPVATGGTAIGKESPEQPGAVKDELPKDRTKTKVADMDPTKGEIFVEGQAKAIDFDKWIITIEQHMDDNSVAINPNVPVKKEAVIQTKDSKTGEAYDITFTEIKTGDVVSFILTKEGLARAVLVNY